MRTTFRGGFFKGCITEKEVSGSRAGFFFSEDFPLSLNMRAGCRWVGFQVSEARYRLFGFSDGVIVLVESDDLGREVLYVLVLYEDVGKYDDPVSHGAFARCGTVEAELPRAPFPRYHIRLEPLAVMHVADHHLLIGKNVDEFHQVRVDGDTTFIREI